MDHNTFSLGIGVRGSILGYETAGIFQYIHGEPCFEGRVSLVNADLEEVFAAVDEDLAKEISKYLPESLRSVSVRCLVLYNHEYMALSIAEPKLQFVIMKKNQAGSGFLLQYDASVSRSGFLSDVLSSVLSVFSLKKVYFYMRDGKGPAISKMMPLIKETDKTDTAVPKCLDDYNVFFYGSSSTKELSSLPDGLNALLGNQWVSVYTGIDTANKNFAMALSFPEISTEIMSINELYIAVGKSGTGLSFEFHGTMHFSYVNAMEFELSCQCSATSFMLNASANLKDGQEPVQLFAFFSIGSCALMIGYQNAKLTFGLMGEIYIRRLMVFAAVILEYEGIIKPSLLCLALSGLTIPDLLSNLIGINIPGIEQFDFIRILPLDFNFPEKFRMEWFEKADYDAISGFFNKNVAEESLELSEDRIKVGRIRGDEGYALVDEKRMRHYYVDADGKIWLRPQFYYSDVPESRAWGDYTISPGIFVCGKIEVFKLSITVLFSMQKDEGLLAFAQVGDIDLGFLKISSPKVLPDMPFHIPEKSILNQFWDRSVGGAVFYLNATKTECSFYFEGQVDILFCITVAARIFYQKGHIYLNAMMAVMGLEARLTLDVAYNDFQNAHFYFCFEINTNRLEEKLTAVSERLTRAIETLRKKIGSATQSLRDAETRVNRLYGEIGYLDTRIADCRTRIRNASWWKKAFVAVAMGIEIAALEVAKASVYAAIYIAKAALEIAIAAVNFAGMLGEGVLRLVQGVILSVTSLFFIRNLKIELSAGKDNRCSFEIRFVALGKEYYFSKTIGTGKMALPEDQNDNILSEISSGMLGKMEPDIEDMEKGVTLTYVQKKECMQLYSQYGLDGDDEFPDLDGARDVIGRISGIQRALDMEYVKEFKSVLPEMEEFDTLLTSHYQVIEANISTIDRSADLDQWGDTVDRMREIVSGSYKQDADIDAYVLDETSEAIQHYDQAQSYMEQLKELQGILNLEENNIQNHREDVFETAGVCHHEKGRDAEPRGEDMRKYLDTVEEIVRSVYGDVPDGSGYINLWKDAEIRNSIELAKEYFR